MFRKLYPDEQWTGPDPAQLSLGRLAGGGAIQSDTCNTAQKTKRLLAEMIAEQARSTCNPSPYPNSNPNPNQNRTLTSTLKPLETA